MNEFVTVSSSSYDPAKLASQLTEKSSQGWTVVAIVPTGGDVTAFLSRASAGGPTAADTSAGEMISSSTDMTPEPAPPTEPNGWAVAPAVSDERDTSPYTATASSAPATVIQSPMSPAGADQSYNTYQPQPAPPAPAAAPAVPAGWYADPAGRFELRYWDGGTWTEHVSRAGQQFTDAPVA